MWLGTPGSNFVLDHNEIYNDINDTDGVVHDECIRVSDLSNLTFTRNHMWSCFVMDVFIGEGTVSSNVVFENNVFGAPTGSSGNPPTPSTPLMHRTTGSSATTPSARAASPS